jgi:hypothetical protein
VERRGAVLAELQSGDASEGDAALQAAMRQFRDEAPRLAMADWPHRFWALLLAQPRLRYRTEVALPLDATDALADLGGGPRAALLLRVAAGLSENEAASALGVATPAYRLALRRALPHHADGRADPEGWQRLREQVHRRIKTLPPDRLLRLAAAREAVLRGDAAPTVVRDGWTMSAVQVPARPRWLMPLLWTLLALCVLALAASFWWPFGDALTGLGGRTNRVRVEALADAEAPASVYGAEAAMLSHPDFDLLADADAQARVRDLDFYSWLAARDAGIASPALSTIETPNADDIAAANAAPPPDANAVLETSEGYDDAPTP